MVIVILGLALFLWAIIVAGTIAIGAGPAVIDAIVTGGAWGIAVVVIGAIGFALFAKAHDAYSKPRRSRIAGPVNRERL